MADGENYSVADDLPETSLTGRYLVVLDNADLDSGIAALTNTAGMAIGRLADLGDDLVDLGLDALGPGQGVVMPTLGIAVVDAPPDQAIAVSTAAAQQNLLVEPEQYVYAWEAAPTLSQKEATWGLQVTGALASPFSGQGIRVAVLDTGMDLAHPDFAERTIVSRSFIQGEEVQDGNGHGTHCIGTACGPLLPVDLPGYPRYGIAYGTEIYAGKVLSNAGRGPDASILAGIEWAVTNGCRIISMSLGSKVLPGAPYSEVYENAAQRAMAAGTLVIAAAGNDSRHQHHPVGRPANCPSIMAVAALNPNLTPADFSNLYMTADPPGGEVNLAGPGVEIFSAAPGRQRYDTMNGTSMATPHVAGIAALWAEANPAASPVDLWRLVIDSARRLQHPAEQVGTGLVQAPVPVSSS
jgi:subtilisin family serine protease